MYNIFSSEFVYRVWIGISDQITESQWLLEDTGLAVVYTNWMDNEPNNGAGGKLFFHRSVIISTII